MLLITVPIVPYTFIYGLYIVYSISACHCGLKILSGKLYLHMCVVCSACAMCFVINASFLLTVISMCLNEVLNSFVQNFEHPRCQSRFIFYPAAVASLIPLRLYCYDPKLQSNTHENSINFTVTPVKHCTAVAVAAAARSAQNRAVDMSVRQFVRVEINQNCSHTS